MVCAHTGFLLFSCVVYLVVYVCVNEINSSFCCPIKRLFHQRVRERICCVCEIIHWIISLSRLFWSSITTRTSSQSTCLHFCCLMNFESFFSCCCLLFLPGPVDLNDQRFLISFLLIKWIICFSKWSTGSSLSVYQSVKHHFTSNYIHTQMSYQLSSKNNWIFILV